MLMVDPFAGRVEVNRYSKCGYHRGNTQFNSQSTPATLRLTSIATFAPARRKDRFRRERPSCPARRRSRLAKHETNCVLGGGIGSSARAVARTAPSAGRLQPVLQNLAPEDAPFCWPIGSCWSNRLSTKVRLAPDDRISRPPTVSLEYQRGQLQVFLFFLRKSVSARLAKTSEIALNRYCAFFLSISVAFPSIDFSMQRNSGYAETDAIELGASR